MVQYPYGYTLTCFTTPCRGLLTGFLKIGLDPHLSSGLMIFLVFAQVTFANFFVFPIWNIISIVPWSHRTPTGEQTRGALGEFNEGLQLLYTVIRGLFPNSR